MVVAQAPSQAKRSRKKLRLGLGLAMCASGVVLFLICFVLFWSIGTSAVDAAVDSVPYPSDSEVQLSAGTWTVYSDRPLEDLSSIEVVDSDRQPMEIVPTRGAFQAPVADRKLGLVEIGSDGTYLVTSSTDADIAVIEGDIASKSRTAFTLFFVGFFLGGALLAAGLVLTIIGAMTKSHAQRL